MQPAHPLSSILTNTIYHKLVSTQHIHRSDACFALFACAGGIAARTPDAVNVLNAQIYTEGQTLPWQT